MTGRAAVEVTSPAASAGRPQDKSGTALGDAMGAGNNSAAQQAARADVGPARCDAKSVGHDVASKSLNLSPAVGTKF
jgi:hypothetical protein